MLSFECNRIFALFRQKSNFILKKDPVRYFSDRMKNRNYKTFNRFTNAIFASAAAIGLSLYIAKKKNIVNGSTKDISDKELNFPVNKLHDHDYSEAISKCRDLLQRVKDEFGAPGMVVGVSIDDKIIWAEGLGYSDVENRLLCSPDTVFRIASISKSITMTAVAKLWEEGKLDLDKPIQHYVPYFPLKDFEGKPVTITCRQLVSHLGGIRHYNKSGNSTAKKNEVTDNKPKKNEITDNKSKKDEVTDNKSKKNNAASEFEEKEYFIKEHYNDVKSSLDLFKDDPLIACPGSKFYYSTHGWTLISAIIEAAASEPFPTHMTKLFKAFGMSNTFLDVNDSLIYYRSRNYIKDKKGCLINAPYVDNSYKWAGGGFLSTVGDLLKFGNAMLYSLQYNPAISSAQSKEKISSIKQNVKDVNQNMLKNFTEEAVANKQDNPGYLKPETVATLWTPVVDSLKNYKYGMGWAMFPDVKECLFCESKTYIFHTGGAVGASSVLMILPHTKKQTSKPESDVIPKGIVVTIITNLQEVGLAKTALKIAQIFEKESKLNYLR